MSQLQGQIHSIYHIIAPARDAMTAEYSTTRANFPAGDMRGMLAQYSKRRRNPGASAEWSPRVETPKHTKIGGSERRSWSYMGKRRLRPGPVMAARC
jgi:hypothetical protein